MGDHNWKLFNSKEDQTGKISKSIFVTNFPDYIRARDLWNVCNGYGSVVDVYIPSKRSKVVKEVYAIPNLYIILSKEGFQTVKLTYLGGLWVLIELDSDYSDKFCESMLLSSIKAWTTNTFPKVASKWGDLVVWEESEENSLSYAWVPKFHNDNYSSNDKSSESDEGYYFLAIMGTWAPSSTKLLIISVYAPQELLEKRELWGYICTLIDRWDGKTVILGDFNEVLMVQERFGSSFNIQGANAFNNFISMVGLIDLPLGGYSYTWSHKSASKMSKVDRFLISEGLMALFPHLSGFDKFVEDSWHFIVIADSNGLSRMKKKFQLLKDDIKTWIKENKKKINEAKSSIQCKLTEVDKSIDQGGGNKEILNQHASLMKYLNGINSIDVLELSQKAKVYWSNEDLVAAVYEFFSSGKFPQGCNSSFIALIMKIHNAKDVKDFR
ncbi:RNA-directed DNA polymerase, eukaryota [Tanacetum coccineum]